MEPGYGCGEKTVTKWLRRQPGEPRTQVAVARPVRAALVIARFFRHESCGQCTQCREGTGWLHKLMVSLEAGTATPSDLDVIDEVTRFMDGHTICALSDAAAWGSGWFLRRFRQEFADHVTHGGCPLSGTSFEV